MPADNPNHHVDVSASELERVQRSLAALGTEDLPGGVAARLTRILDAQPPLVAPRRGRVRRRFALAGLAPALAAGVVAVVILASPTAPRHHQPALKQPAAAAAPASGTIGEARVQAAPSTTVPSPPQSTGVGQASAAQALSRAHSDAVTDAARAAYDAAEAAIHARRVKP